MKQPIRTAARMAASTPPEPGQAQGGGGQGGRVSGHGIDQAMGEMKNPGGPVDDAQLTPARAYRLALTRR